jgi:hypothetical protein
MITSISAVYDCSVNRFGLFPVFSAVLIAIGSKLIGPAANFETSVNTREAGLR